MLAFHLRITPQPKQRLVCHVLMGVCAAWAVAAMSVVGVRCGKHVEGSSAGGRCIDYVSVIIVDKVWDDYQVKLTTKHKATGWIGIAVGDSTLELMLLAVPIWIVWSLQTSFVYKSMIITSFALRLWYVARHFGTPALS